MRVYHDWKGLQAADRGASVAMGNFDGVHLGHQAVIGQARGHAAPLGIVTFEPHPRQFFAPVAPPFRLMNAEARTHRLEKLGVAELYELPFDARLAGMEAETFVAEVLVAGLGVAILPSIVLRRAIPAGVRTISSDCDSVEAGAIWDPANDSVLLRNFVAILRGHASATSA